MRVTCTVPVLALVGMADGGVGGQLGYGEVGEVGNIYFIVIKNVRMKDSNSCT